MNRRLSAAGLPALLALFGWALTPASLSGEDGGGRWGGMSKEDRDKMIQMYQKNAQNVKGGSAATPANTLDQNGQINNQAQTQASMKSLQELLKKAQQAIKDQQYLTASKLAAVVVSVEGKGTEGLHDNAMQLLLQLEDKAKTIYDVAEEAYIQKDYETATDNFAIVVTQFPATMVYTKAKARLMEIRSNPKLAAKAAFVEAQKTEEGEDYFVAIQLYEQVIQKFPDTPAAVKSKKAIDAIHADPDKKAKLEAKAGALSEAELKTNYTLACNYTNAMPKDEAEQKTFDKGMKIFQMIVDEYPTTEYAAKSKEKLDALVAAVNALKKQKPTATAP